MGGEQWPILAYGSKFQTDMKEWIYKLNIIDFNKFKENKQGMEEYTDKELYDKFYIVEDDDINKLFDFVEYSNMIIVYFSNYKLDDFSIGLEVKDFNNITDIEKDKVTNFCDKYNLGIPTFYAGIIGEF